MKNVFGISVWDKLPDSRAARNRNCSHAPAERTLERPTVPWLHVISAEGAVVTWLAWRSAPGIQVMPEAQALTARFISSLVLSLQN